MRTTDILQTIQCSFAKPEFKSRSTGVPRRLAVCLAIFFLFLCALQGLYAQTLSGVTGTVTDRSGAVVSGAKVMATNIATGIMSHAVTSTFGTYTITDLIPGVYTVKIEMQGFQSSVHNQVNVEVGTQATVDATLQPGSTSEAIEVNSEAITLETDQPQLGTTIENKIVQEVPVEVGGVNGGVNSAGRQIDDYLFLAPGVQGGEFSHRINGGLDFQNEVVFNGVAAVQSETKGFQSFINPPFEMVNEFRVLGSTFSAQYGLAQGVATYQFASGTNRLHGDGFEILRNDYFDAKGGQPQFDQNHHPLTPVDKENNYGFSVGGPVIFPKLYDGRNKTFFYTSLEWYRRNQSAIPTGGAMTVPTALEKSGSFTDYPFPIFVPPNWTPPAGCNPGAAAGQQFPGNIIPQACFSAVSKSLLQFVPNPDRAGSGSPIIKNLGSQAGVVGIRQTNWGFSLDHNLTDKQKIHGSFWRDKNNTPACCDNNAFYPVSNPLTGINPQVRLGTGLFLTYSNTFTDKLVMTAGIGWMGEINNQFNPNTHLPFAGVTGSSSLPAINFNAGDDPNQPDSWGQARTTSINRKLGISFDNNWLYIHGRHTTNFGFEIHRAYQDDHECQQCGGNVNFSDHTTSDGTNFGTTGSGFASFLLGVVDSSTRQIAAPNKLRNLYVAPYVQDNVKITPRLTVDAGIRWDLMRPFTDVHDDVTFFDPTIPNPHAINPANGQSLLGAANKLGTCAGCAGFRRADMHWLTFSPRLGFTFELNKKTVLLSGYALNFLESGAFEFGTHKVANDYGQLLSGVFSANSNNSNIAGFGEWDNNPIPNPPSLPFSPTIGIATGALHRFARDPGTPAYSQAWNAGIERELPWNMFLSLSYVGNRDVHLPARIQNPNQLDPKFLNQFCPPGTPATVCILGKAWTSAAEQAALQSAGFAKTTVTCPSGSSGTFFTPYANFLCDFGASQQLSQALRPFPMFGGVTYNFDNSGVATYNALQAQVQRHFTNGVSFLVAYTLSRTMSNTDSGFATFNGRALNKFNPKAEWALANNDQEHILSISGVYELPIGQGKTFLNGQNFLVRNLLGGWQASGVFSYSSGQPFGISANGTPTRAGGNRANLVPGVPLNLNWNNYYKPCVLDALGNCNGVPALNFGAFSDPGRWSIGTSSRNLASLRNPFNANESVALAKHMHFGERVSGELRVEFFNILNRMQICGGPNQNGAMDNNISNWNPPSVKTFGVINGGLKSDGSGNCQNNLPRQGQAFFKINF